MKANNLTVMLPYHGCNKNCPYCISKMTGINEQNSVISKTKIQKVITLAKAAQVTNVLLTGKGEPIQDAHMEKLIKWIEYFNEFPLEIQTNGITLTDFARRNVIVFWLEKLANSGLDTIAISIDSFKQLTDDFYLVCKKIREAGINLRWTINVNDKTFSCVQYITKGINIAFRWISFANAFGAQQITFRRLNAPKGKETTDEGKWIKENTKYEDEFFYHLYLVLGTKKSKKVLELSDIGISIYDVCVNGENISVAVSEYYIQDSAKNDSIRSLILMNDGHVYTSWDSKASLLF